jgi:hypothetical protein
VPPSPANAPRLPAPPRRRPGRGRLAAFACAGALTAFGAGLAVREGRIVPDVEQVTRAGQLDLPQPPPARGASGAVWTLDEIRGEFARTTHAPPVVSGLRGTFLRADHPWLTRFTAWFRSLEKPLRIQFANQLWDCDNYANGYVAFADLVTLEAGGQRPPFCVGRASVFYRVPFAGVRGGAHAVVIVGTTEGLFVIEPQDGTMVPLKKFPNRHTIEAVYF